MNETDEFVTILRSSNAHYVASVVALLEGEGIPCEHPGMNHASMLPGLTYIEVQLRVPRSRLDEATALLGTIEAVDEGPKVAFRVHRSQEILGACTGVVLTSGVLVVTHATRLGMSQLAVLVLLAVAASLGYGIGRTRRRDICSQPSCGGPLREADAVCPKCGSTIAGEIRRAEDHFAAQEVLERAGPDTEERSG